MAKHRQEHKVMKEEELDKYVDVIFQLWMYSESGSDVEKIMIRTLLALESVLIT